MGLQFKLREIREVSLGRRHGSGSLGSRRVREQWRTAREEGPGKGSGWRRDRGLAVRACVSSQCDSPEAVTPGRGLESQIREKGLGRIQVFGVL